MSSPIDICNRALSEIGTRSNIASFDEGSKESVACTIWYDPMRRMLLRAAAWGFARYQTPMTELGNLNDGTSIYPWPFKYTLPPDCLKMRYVLPPSPPAGSTDIGLASAYCTPSRANRFIIANERDPASLQRRVVLTNVCQAQAVFTIDVQDVGLMDDLFQNALVSALASKLVIPLTGNKDMRAGFISSATDAVTAARVSDGNEAQPTTDSTPDWMTVRGVMPVYGFGAPGLGNLGSWFGTDDPLNWGM